MPRALCVLVFLFAACGEAPTALQRTLAEGSARFELTVARGPSAARSTGVLDFAAAEPIDLAEWVVGSKVATDRHGRIVRVVFRQQDVAVTLVLTDFGTPVPSGPRGREDGGHLRGRGGALALASPQGLR